MPPLFSPMMFRGPFFGGCGHHFNLKPFAIAGGIVGSLAVLFGGRNRTNINMQGGYMGMPMYGYYPNTYMNSGYYPGTYMNNGYYPGLSLSAQQDPLSGLKGLYPDYNFEMIEGKYCARLKDGSGDVITASSQQELIQKLGASNPEVSSTAQAQADEAAEVKKQSVAQQGTAGTVTDADDADDDDDAAATGAAAPADGTPAASTGTPAGGTPAAGSADTAPVANQSVTSAYNPKSGQYWYGIVANMYVDADGTAISGKDLAKLTSIVKQAHGFEKVNPNMPSAVQLPNEIKINGTKYTLSQEHINDIPRDTQAGGVTENKDITPAYKAEY